MERRSLSRVLVGTDGSVRAGVAVDQAIRLAAIAGAPLDVVFVIDAGRPHTRSPNEIAESALDAATSSAEASDVECECRIVAGDPATSLMRLAEERRADLLCVGPDVGLADGPPRVGLATWDILHKAPCPVLVARAAGPDFPSRIVCGADDPAGSAELAAFASSLAGANASITTVGRVLPPHALVGTSRRLRADLLVVGNRERGGDRTRLGDDIVLCTVAAPCSVLTRRSRR